MSKRFTWTARILLLPIVLTAIVLLALLCDRMLWIDWVGHTDLAITFIVVDAETEEPIPNAVLHVHSDGGLFEEREATDFELVTDLQGTVTRLCRRCMCGGQGGLLRNTFFVSLPWWSIHASAPGYSPNETIVLNETKYSRRVERNREGATLSLRISLPKKSLESKAN